MQAARSLKLSLMPSPDAAGLDSAKILADAQRLLASAPPWAAGARSPPGTLYTVEARAASAHAALARSGVRVLDATSVLPYVAHACMEVLNFTVAFMAGVRCNVHAPTKSARSVLAVTMALTGMRESQVRIHTTLLGGGLGKAEVDFLAQTVQLGMALQRPVQLV